MKFYAIVLCLKQPAGEPVRWTAWQSGSGLIMFATIEDARKEIHMYSLDESYEKVSVIELGEEIPCLPDTPPSSESAKTE